MSTGLPKLLFVLMSSLISFGVLAEPLSEEQPGGSSNQADEPDKCDQSPAQDKLPEKVQSGVHEITCRSVRWIDSLFGNSVDFEEEAVSGKLSLGMAWNEFEGTDATARFRVRTDLPNFSDRWDAFIGRLDEDTYISDTETLQESAFRQGISGTEENDWLLGLGYKNRSGTGAGWDYSVGLRFRTPVRLYVKARYRRSMKLGPSLDLRYRQTVFWRDGTGFGTTSHIDTARELSPQNVLRWELLGTVSEDTEGVQWWVGNTWYHNLGEQRGVSLLTFARGETNTEVPLHDYGLELTWRRQVAREWLFINVGPTLTWPRLRLDQKREASLGFAVLMEFEFGRYRRP
jgi:hypothetical protein